MKIIFIIVICIASLVVEQYIISYNGETTKADDNWSGARPTKHISIEFEIRWKFKTL